MKQEIPMRSKDEALERVTSLLLDYAWIHLSIRHTEAAGKLGYHPDKHVWLITLPDGTVTSDGVGNAVVKAFDEAVTKPDAPVGFHLDHWVDWLYKYIREIKFEILDKE